jgi:putative glutamine amidotransferase
MPQPAARFTHLLQERSGDARVYTRRMPPVVGITQCLDERERWRPGREYLYLDRAYVAAVECAGAGALMLPIQADAIALVQRIDALLLPGGDDFAPPSPYPAGVTFDPAPERQLAFDRSVLAAARARRIPILGICYGAQLMALERGGRLHHHLPHDLPDSADHRLPERDGRHPVMPEPDSLLARLVGPDPLLVNSLHHQAVAEPGSGMRVSARSGDGVVEAIECVDAPFELGVQWHPEKLEGSAGARLFDALVDACGRG